MLLISIKEIHARTKCINSMKRVSGEFRDDCGNSD